MDLRIYPSRLHGSVAAIPSKSDVHRLLISAALADRATGIACPAASEDIFATARCLSALGSRIRYDSGVFTVFPIEKVPESPVLDCGESGSTLRFLLPVAAALGSPVTFTGRGRLPERPIGELVDELSAHGAVFSAERLPFTVTGPIRGGKFTLPGNVSSQYVTGLLFALPLMPEGGRITLTSPLESKSYVDMTLSSLARFGVEVSADAGGFAVPAGRRYLSPGTVTAEGDWSNAAFFLAAGVTVTGLDPASPQGDRSVTAALAAIMGGNASIDLKNTPDMLPALSIAAAVKEGGKTEFCGAARLRIKESDRLKTVAAMILGLGGRAEEKPDGLTVYGTGLIGGEADASGDHRIAMAAAICAAFSENGAILRGAEAVNKSYPGFWEDFGKLGGKYDVI